MPKDTVLIVDDNQEISHLLCTYIQNLVNKGSIDINVDITNVDCLSYTEADTAVSDIIANGYKYNIKFAILDIMMGGKIDGNFLLIETLLKMYPNIYIILMTGILANDSRLAIFKNKPIKIIHKPFDIDVIGLMVKAVFGEVKNA